jgi:hypothetical protein
VGPNVPATETRLDPTTATCSNPVAEVRVGHALLLAPFCDSYGFVYVDSLYIECGYGNEFFVPEVDEVYRYSCAETMLFASAVTTTKDIPSTVIMTDQSWQENEFLSDCVRVTKRGDDTNKPSLAPRATTVTIMPVSDNRGAMPPAIVNNNGATTTLPSAASTTPRGDSSSNPDEASSKKASTGIIVGVTVGAVLFLAIAGAVLFVMLCWKPQQQQRKGESQIKEVSEHADIPPRTGYTGQGEHRLAVDEQGGLWTGHAPAAVVSPALPVYAAGVEVMPMEVMPMEVTDDDPASGDRLMTAKSTGSNDHRVTAKSTGSNDDFPSGERSGDRNSAPDGDYRYSNPGQQQDVAVTFKDQAQSMVVDGHPMTASNPFHLSPRTTATAATAQARGSDSRRYAYQQQDNVVAPVTFKDNTQSMIRPETIGVPTHAMDQENAHSGLTDADDTRGSSDPSGIYSHEMTMLDSNYGSNNDGRGDA